MDANIFETQMLLLSGPLPSYQAESSKSIFPETTDIEDGNDFMSHLQDEMNAENTAHSYGQDEESNNQGRSDNDNSYSDQQQDLDAETNATQQDNERAAANDVDANNGESDEAVAAMVNDMRKKSKETTHLDKALEGLLASAVNSKEHAKALSAQLKKKGNKELSEIMENLLQAVPHDQRKAFLKKLKALSEQSDLKAMPDMAQNAKKTAKAEKGSKEDALEGLLKTIKTAMDKNEDDDMSALVATGLTPQELTKIYDNIMKALNGKDTEEAANAMGALIKIKDAIGENDKLNMPSSPLSALTGDELALAGPAGKEKVLSSFAAKLNALITGGKSKKTGSEGLKIDLGEMAKVIENAQQNSGATRADGTQNALPKSAPSPTSLMSPAMLNALNENFISLNAAGMESVDAEIVSSLQAKNLNITNLSNLTNVSQNAQQASQPHPATKMVASQITKAVTEGQTRINIRLNPPELGRVEIRMQFNEASNSVKAHVIAEKPETYMMMQRDAHMLEKAMQDSGLEIDGGSINFELAQDQNLFDHNDRRDGHGSTSSGDKSAKGDDTEEDVIETTMDWYFDPDSGVMRYDVLV